jgi:predicted  nucleic acid-binding Zn-ribbon protein
MLLLHLGEIKKMMIAPLAALLRLHEINETVRTQGEKAVNRSEVNRLLQSLTPQLHRHYLTACRRFGETPIAVIERGACTGCHTRQPAQLPEIDEGVYQCHHCGRLVYLPEEAYELYVG